MGRVETEIHRCVRAIGDGSPREFWLSRLGRFADALESGAAALRTAMADIATPTCPHGVSGVCQRCDLAALGSFGAPKRRP